MRTHRRVCYIPDRPGHSHTVPAPDWLQPFTCTVVLLPLHSCPVSPSRSKDRCTVCSSPELLGAGGSQLFLREPETSAVGASLTTTPLHLSSILRVFHPAGGPGRTPLLCSGLGWCLDVQTEHRRGPGFTLSEAEAKGELKLVVFFPSLFVLALCSCVYVCVQELKDTRNPIFCLRYVAVFHLLSDSGKMVDVQHLNLWEKITEGRLTF